MWRVTYQLYDMVSLPDIVHRGVAGPLRVPRVQLVAVLVFRCTGGVRVAGDGHSIHRDVTVPPQSHVDGVAGKVMAIRPCRRMGEVPGINHVLRAVE